MGISRKSRNPSTRISATLKQTQRCWMWYEREEIEQKENIFGSKGYNEKYTVLWREIIKFGMWRQFSSDHYKLIERERGTPSPP
jgi:hypothetical protein